MLELIKTYGDELGSRLADRVDPDRLPIILREVTTHLEESTLEIARTRNLDPERAALEAIIAFGDARGIAIGFIRELRGCFWGLPASQVACGASLVSTSCLVFAVTSFRGYFDNFGESWECVPAALIGAISLAVLLLSCRAQRRSSRKPLLLSGIAGALCLIPLLSFWIIGDTGMTNQGVSRFHRSRDIANLGLSITTLEWDRQFIERTAPLVMEAKSPDQLPAAVVDGDWADRQWSPEGRPRLNDAPEFVTPRFVAGMVDGRLSVFGTAETLRETQARWSRSASTVKGIDKQIKVFESLRNEALHPGLFYWNPKVFLWPVILALLCVPFYLFVDLIARLTRIGRREIRRILA